MRIALEPGRLLRSAGDPDAAGPYFDVAAATAQQAGLDRLTVDALHMLALVSEPGVAFATNEEALSLAQSSPDPLARDWDASLSNLGMTLADGGDFEGALLRFEEALEARARIGDGARTRVARWMVGRALRHLGRTEEALALQLDLRAELESDGESDAYVGEEIALLHG